MFRENLMKIVDNVEGGLAGLLMGFDGIAVESYAKDQQSLDIQTVGMEFSFILTQVRKAAEILEVGKVQEVSIKTETINIIIRVLNQEYFLALALGPGGNFGKGRYLLRVVAPKLQSEL
jgi:predicted regulator of Ras-like GTPase activity (Roadblock/LC7/MglB family)